MGIDTLSISKSKPLKVLINGVMTPVYREKAGWRWNDIFGYGGYYESKETKLARAGMRAALGRLQEAWGTERPAYYTYDDSNHEFAFSGFYGGEVYANAKKVVWPDCDKNGEKVGYLIGGKKGWELSPTRPLGPYQLPPRKK